MIDSTHSPTSLATVARDRPVYPAVIVAGLDGSAGGVEIARIAASLAVATGGRVELVHVLGAGPRMASAPAAEHERAEAQAMLDGLCESSACAATGTLVESGDPARRIAAVAESVRADVIVVGTRGNAAIGDALLGSVSGRLAADAPCPVLVVAPVVQQHVRPESWHARTLVCGFDGSDAAWAAAEQAALLAGRMDGTVSLVCVGTAVSWRMAEVADALREAVTARHPGAAVAPISWEVRSGDPAWELECVASAITAPLIAVGSRGLGPWRDPLLGSVTRRMLLSARRPILVMPATAVGDGVPPQVPAAIGAQP